MTREIKKIIQLNKDKRLVLPGHQSQELLIHYYLEHDLVCLAINTRWLWDGTCSSSVVVVYL